MPVIGHPDLYTDKFTGVAQHLERQLSLRDCGRLTITEPGSEVVQIVVPSPQAAALLVRYFSDSLSCIECAELIDDLSHDTTYESHLINRTFSLLNIDPDRLSATGRVAALASVMMLLYISRRLAA